MSHILSCLLWLPLASAILILFVPEHRLRIIRGIAVSTGLGILGIASAITALGSLKLPSLAPGDYLFVDSFQWMPKLGVTYKLGVDGLSLPMILLTGIVSAAALFMSHRIKDRPREFYALSLLAICGSLGTFLTVDLFFFILFYEMASIPMFFLIAMWGSDKSGSGRSINRNGAATKVLIYLQGGGAMVLLGLIGTYFLSGTHSFDMTELQTASFSPILQRLLFAFLFIGFGIESGLFPFHTWLPDGHSCAPTPLSMLLAGVLLKMGGYGIFRVGFQLFPIGAQELMPIFMILGLINLIYGGLCALRQTDIKVMIAYSSVSHMGVVFLGMACINSTTASGALYGLSGAIFQMFSHGVITALLFGVAGSVYDVTHARDYQKWGGLAARMPRFATFYMIAALASLGLPGFTGYPSELSVFLGLYETQRVVCALGLLGLILATTYLLRSMQYGFFGPLNPIHAHAPDACNTDLGVFSALTLATLLFGVYPDPMVRIFQPFLQPIIGGLFF